MDSKIANLTGKRFGRLVVLNMTEKRKNRYIVWNCRCDCGNYIEVPSNTLRGGNTKSCGCLQKTKAKRANIEGEKYGRLTAVMPTEKRIYRAVVWLCQCECGNTVEVSVNRLNCGLTKSCGCLKSRHRLT